MSLFFGRGDAGAEQRTAWGVEPAIPAPGASVGGSRVSLARADAALQKVAVFASVNLLGTLLQTVPIDFFTGQGPSKRQVPIPGWLKDPQGDGFELADFLYQFVYCLGLRGNFVCKVAARDYAGRPTVLTPAHPDDVHTWRDPDTGMARWRIGSKEVPRGDIFHRRAYPTPGQIKGLSPIAVHALTVGTGLAAEQFALQWFTDGAHPSGMLTNDKLPEISQESATTLKARFLASIRGTREPVVLAGGWKYTQVQIAPGESQFLETQRYTSSECARIYGPGMPEMLGYDTGHSMTYTNVEQRSLDLLTYTVDPWLVRAETMINALLPAPQWCKFNRAALLRTDALTRYQVHQIGLENQITTVNEVRQLEDQPPVAWGDLPVPHIKPDLTGKVITPSEAAGFPAGSPSEGSQNVSPYLKTPPAASGGNQ